MGPSDPLAAPMAMGEELERFGVAAGDLAGTGAAAPTRTVRPVLKFLMTWDGMTEKMQNKGGHQARRHRANTYHKSYPTARHTVKIQTLPGIANKPLQTSRMNDKSNTNWMCNATNASWMT